MTDDARTARLRVMDELEPWIDTARYYNWRNSTRLAEILDAYAAALRREGALTTLRKLHRELDITGFQSTLARAVIQTALSEAERGEAP